MTDICHELRKASTHALMSASRQTVLDAAAEIERLRLTARDHFAAAALTGLVANGDYSLESAPVLAWRMADAMLRERAASAEKDSDLRDSRNAKTTDHDAAPDAYRRFAGEVMNWISEATSTYEPRSDGGRRIMADACMQCWDAFNRIAYPTTNHDAAPAARADSRPLGNPVASAVAGTGKQPAPPCVETDGFSPDSRTGQINRTPECESPRRECGESQRRDVPQPDNGRAAGGPAQNTLRVWVAISKAEIDALQHVVEGGRLVDLSDYGHLRSLLVMLRPEWEGEDVSDRSKPIGDERLAALEQLSALDQKLELEYGLTGNPLIKARHNNEST